MISQQEILDKTHYGLGIYTHILREVFPTQSIKLKGRITEHFPNPLDNGDTQLFLEEVKGVFLYFELGNTANSGSPFDFSSKFFKMKDEELLLFLDEVLNLGIIKKQNLRNRISGFSFEQIQPPKCSFFHRPVRNIHPQKTLDILEIYQRIKENYEKETLELRAIKAPKDARIFKANHFDYVTFSGVFTTRKDENLTAHSGLLCIDFDHLADINSTKKLLLEDEYFPTELLFSSPSGEGIKWIIKIDLKQDSHINWFSAVKNYLKIQYELEADSAGKDVSRACFLPHDPEVFINAKYLQILKNRANSL